MTNWTAGMDITTSRLQNSTWSDVLTYTPVVGNSGVSSWSVDSGWYYTAGKIVFFGAYLSSGSGGSGATNVTLTAPTSIDRTIRQIVPCWFSGIRVGYAVALVSGSGNVFDELDLTNPSAVGASSLTGNNISNGQQLIVTGMYRSA